MAAKTGVSPIRVSGRVLPSLVTTAAVFASGCLDGPGRLQPFDLRVRAVDHVEPAGPVLAEPGADLLGERLGFLRQWAWPRGGRPSVCIDSLSAAPAGWARVKVKKSESPSAAHVLMACPSCWLVG